MNIEEVIDRYNGCVEAGCAPGETCEGCEFDLPLDVWGVIDEYAKGV